MVVMVVMMMMRLRKSGRGNHQDHGQKQSLFHVHDHNNKGPARMPLRVTFGLRHNPQWYDARSQEKSSSALTTALALCRVRRKKTRVMSK
jgi:hypothetical protein